MKPITPDFIENVIQLTCTIQAIPAPTFNEGPRADFVWKRFQALGLQDIQRDSVGNVLGRLPGADEQANPRPLFVSAHIDTVHPLGTPLNAHIFPDQIIGPGIGDNALGLAAMLSLIDLLREQGTQLPGSLWLAANVGEEGLGDLRGMEAIVDRFQGQPLAYIVLEGMGLGTVLHRGLGVERYRISVQTPGGHSWVNYGQPSAIHELCRLVTRLTNTPLPHSPCTTMNVGVISGGTSVNTVAANAWCELDLRSEDKRTLAEIVHQVHVIARAAQKRKVDVQVERIGRRLAGELSARHPLVGLASGILEEMGLQPRLEIASTDANLPLSRGYPAICVGITNGHKAHTTEETIFTAQIGMGMEQLYRLVTQAWGHLG
jgi:acetylornithine deacetylase/succinyl-diaminopimelate desuccinylase-like protein